MLHLISLNKYIVSLIVKEGNSSVMYNLVVSLFLYLGLVSELSSPGMIVPAIEKILLLANVGGGGLKESASPLMKKFITSSIMGCLGIGVPSNKVSSFSLRVLSSIGVS